LNIFELKRPWTNKRRWR